MGLTEALAHSLLDLRTMALTVQPSSVSFRHICQISVWFSLRPLTCRAQCQREGAVCERAEAGFEAHSNACRTSSFDAEIRGRPRGPLRRGQWGNGMSCRPGASPGNISATRID